MHFDYRGRQTLVFITVMVVWDEQQQFFFYCSDKLCSSSHLHALSAHMYTRACYVLSPAYAQVLSVFACKPMSTVSSAVFPMSLRKWVNGKSNEVGSCPLVPWEISQQESELISPSLTPSLWWGCALDHAPYMLHGCTRSLQAMQSFETSLISC